MGFLFLFLKKNIFYHIRAWQPYWLCDLNNLLFPLHKEASNETWLRLALRFQKTGSLKMAEDGHQTTDARPLLTIIHGNRMQKSMFSFFACTATEDGYRLEILDTESKDCILY